MTPATPSQECWCKDKPDHGSFFCCQSCPAKDGPSVDYHLEYVVTYRCCSAHMLFAVTTVDCLQYKIVALFAFLVLCICSAAGHCVLK